MDRRRWVREGAMRCGDGEWREGTEMGFGGKKEEEDR